MATSKKQERDCADVVMATFVQSVKTGARAQQLDSEGVVDWERRVVLCGSAIVPFENVRYMRPVE